MSLKHKTIARKVQENRCGGSVMAFLMHYYVFSLSDAFDTELMCQTLKDIIEGKVVEVPTYDFITHSRQ